MFHNICLKCHEIFARNTAQHLLEISWKSRLLKQPSLKVVLNTTSAPKCSLQVFCYIWPISLTHVSPFNRNIFASDIFARDIFVRNIPARNIFARHIFARNIIARNIFSGNIFARNISSRQIFARNIFYRNIFARNTMKFLQDNVHSSSLIFLTHVSSFWPFFLWTLTYVLYFPFILCSSLLLSFYFLILTSDLLRWIISNYLDISIYLVWWIIVIYLYSWHSRQFPVLGPLLGLKKLSENYL